MCYNRWVKQGSAPSYSSELLHHCTCRTPFLLFVRHTHSQTPVLQPQNPWLSHFLTLQHPHLEQLPQDTRHSATHSLVLQKHSATHSLFLQKQAQDINFSSQKISLFFLPPVIELSNIVFHPYHCISRYSVYVCVCVCASFTCLNLCQCLHKSTLYQYMPVVAFS